MIKFWLNCYLRVKGWELETKAVIVFLYVKQDVEDAQALILPCVSDLEQAARVQ